MFGLKRGETIADSVNTFGKRRIGLSFFPLYFFFFLSLLGMNSGVLQILVVSLTLSVMIVSFFPLSLSLPSLHF